MMKISERAEKKAAVLQLHGRVLGGPECKDVLASVNALKKKGLVNIVFDFEDVTLMNSNGLAIITAAHNTLQESGGAVRLSRCRDRIRRILVGAKVEDLFQVFDSIDGAVESFPGT